MPRRAILAADRALQLTDGKEAKAWYRRAAAWLACGEFNEAIADCDAAKRIEPGDKAIVALRKKAEEDRENATWGFAADQRKVERLNDDDNSGDAWREAEAENGVCGGDWMEGASSLLACRAMIEVEEFTGESVELADGTLTLKWAPNEKHPEGREKVFSPAMLDQRALFCIEEATKRSKLRSLTIRGGCLGAWGAAFIARGARVEGAGLETLVLVDCRLRAEGATSVASLLSRGSKLVDVDLSGNHIGDDGVHALSKELVKNEYLERLKLSRNYLTNKRMPQLGEALGMHPALRSLDLSHNLIGYPAAIHLATGLQSSGSLQHLSVAHTKCRADAIYRLANVCSGHVSLATLDCRGVRLRKADRKKLEAHSAFTRLQVLIDQPKEERPVAKTPEDGDDGLVIEENDADNEPGKTVTTGDAPVDVADEEAVTLPASLLERTDILKKPSAPRKEEESVKQAAATDSMEESVVNRNEWKLPAGDISTREWVTGFAQLRLW